MQTDQPPADHATPPPKGTNPTTPSDPTSRGRSPAKGTIGVGVSTGKDTPPVHHISEAEATELLTNMSTKQLAYIVARLLDPTWSFVKCARTAGYTKTSAQQTGSANERHAHISRILRLARLNRSGESTLEIDKLDREAAIEFYSQLAQDVEYSTKVRMDAVKALRELEAWDKQGGQGQQTVNVLQVIMEQIDGQGVLPSGLQGQLSAKTATFEAISPTDGGGVEAETVEVLPIDEAAREAETDPPDPSDPTPTPSPPVRLTSRPGVADRSILDSSSSSVTSSGTGIFCDGCGCELSSDGFEGAHGLFCSSECRRGYRAVALDEDPFR